MKNVLLISALFVFSACAPSLGNVSSKTARALYSEKSMHNIGVVYEAEKIILDQCQLRFYSAKEYRDNYDIFERCEKLTNALLERAREIQKQPTKYTSAARLDGALYELIDQLENAVDRYHTAKLCVANSANAEKFSECLNKYPEHTCLVALPDDVRKQGQYLLDTTVECTDELNASFRAADVKRYVANYKKCRAKFENIWDTMDNFEQKYPNPIYAEPFDRFVDMIRGQLRLHDGFTECLVNFATSKDEKNKFKNLEECVKPFMGKPEDWERTKKLFQNR